MPRKKIDIAEQINHLIKKSENYAHVKTAIASDKKLCFLLLKKKEITTVSVNNKNVFQPYEKTEQKEIITLFILTNTTRALPADFKKYKQIGCPVVFLTDDDSVEKICEEI